LVVSHKDFDSIKAKSDISEEIKKIANLLLQPDYFVKDLREHALMTQRANNSTLFAQLIQMITPISNHSKKHFDEIVHEIVEQASHHQRII
jgi:hypothetical protein